MDDFALMDFHRAREAIDAGRVCVEASAPQLLSIVAQLHPAVSRTPTERTGP
jgi:hypothetical protein